MMSEPNSREEILQAIVKSYIDSLLAGANNVFKFAIASFMESYKEGKMDRKFLHNIIRVLSALTIQIESDYDHAMPNEKIEKMINDQSLPEGEFKVMSCKTKENATFH